LALGSMTPMSCGVKAKWLLSSNVLATKLIAAHSINLCRGYGTEITPSNSAGRLNFLIPYSQVWNSATDVFHNAALLAS
jgi:hypothetical protein